MRLPFFGPRAGTGAADAEKRIIASAIVAITVAVLAAGASVFALMQQRIEDSVAATLRGGLDARRKLVQSLFEMREAGAELIAAQPELWRALGQGGPQGPAQAAAASAAVRNLIGTEFRGIAVLDTAGKEIAREGRFSDEAVRTTQIESGLHSDLRLEKTLLLRTRVEVRDGARVLGAVIVEQSMPILEGLMRGDTSVGETGEMALCFARRARLLCYPMRLRPEAFEVPRTGADGKPLPMSLALDGATGVMRARDYRDHSVIAAYGPLEGTGLGMVLKVDTAELLAPLRAQLVYLVLVLALAIAAGAALVRSRVRPLAARLAAAEKAARDARDQLELALEASGVAVWETDLRSGEVVLSEAWARLMEREPEETRTSVAELSALVHPTELGALRRLSAEVVKGTRPDYLVEHRVSVHGGWKWILSRGRVVERDANGRALRMMGTNLDITGRKRDELHLERLAHYDSLTGAANRVLFRDRLAQAIARSKRNGVRGALIYLDIDKFKGINDTLGHAAGDALLQAFAARLRDCVRAIDTVGRLGGDEFALLLEDATPEGAAAVAEKVLAAMREPVDADGSSVVVTTSLGIAGFGGEDELEALARRADAALYEAKAAGRACYRVAA